MNSDVPPNSVPWERFQSLRRGLIAAVSVAIVVSVAAAGLALVAYSSRSSPQPTSPAVPGVVNLTSIQMTFFYLNNSPPIFGPIFQDGCANCPVMMHGGQLSMLWVRAPTHDSNTTTLEWLNISSPIPFQALDCSTPPVSYGGWDGCPFVTTFDAPELESEGGLGELGIPLVFSVPSSAPSVFSYGFQVQVDVTVLALPTTGLVPM
jgi:hypothetical protein